MDNSVSITDPIAWRDGQLVLLDQTCLPARIAYVHCDSADAVYTAIRDMVVRGAPAIGIAAAYGVALSARSHFARRTSGWRAALISDIAKLAEARPTAINLSWALDEMSQAIPTTSSDPFPPLLARAQQLQAADFAANQRMGELGASLLTPGCGVLTHCNAGALATSGYGTALGVIRSAHAEARVSQVYACETRPWLQGARLTAWELMQDGIDVTLLVDSAAAHLMQSGKVQWVITGADRIAANGDTANKIGTYGLATLARAHGLKFMVAAPLSTIDRAIAGGSDIPIEHRSQSEITHFRGDEIAAPGVTALNPVFDVTPAHLIDALVTEAGVIMAPDKASIDALFSS